MDARAEDTALTDATLLDAQPAGAALLAAPRFDQLAVSDEQYHEYEQLTKRLSKKTGVDAQQYHLGCVVRLDRGFPAVCCADATLRAQYAPVFSRDAAQVARDSDKSSRSAARASRDAALRTSRQSSRGKKVPACASRAEDVYEGVAVGDWVVVRRPHAHDMGVIEAVIKRKNQLARWRGSRRGTQQVLAANVDVVFIAQPLLDASASVATNLPAAQNSAPALDINRIVRSLVIARDCSARPVIVLTKADRITQHDQLIEQILLLRRVVGTDIPVVVTSSSPTWQPSTQVSPLASAPFSAKPQTEVPDLAQWGLEALRSYAVEKTCALVLGESGAGKSSLLNALLGHEALQTAEVRASDDAGRHTTVARRMVKIPHGGVIIDAPGLRNLALMGHEQGLSLVFSDIVDAAQDCKFRDCTHAHEPGCQVMQAIRSEHIAPERLAAYAALAQEMESAARSLAPDIDPAMLP